MVSNTPTSCQGFAILSPAWPHLVCDSAVSEGGQVGASFRQQPGQAKVSHLHTAAEHAWGCTATFCMYFSCRHTPHMQYGPAQHPWPLPPLPAAASTPYVQDLSLGQAADGCTLRHGTCVTQPLAHDKTDKPQVWLLVAPLPLCCCGCCFLPVALVDTTTHLCHHLHSP